MTPDPASALRRLPGEARRTIMCLPADGGAIWKSKGRVPTAEGLRQLREAGCAEEPQRGQWRLTALGIAVHQLVAAPAPRAANDLSPPPAGWGALGNVL